METFAIPEAVGSLECQPQIASLWSAWSVSQTDGGREWPQRVSGRRESHTEGFVPWTALKQVQCEIKEEIDGGGGPMSQCEENTLFRSYHVSEYNVISSRAALIAWPAGRAGSRANLTEGARGACCRVPGCALGCLQGLIWSTGGAASSCWPSILSPSEPVSSLVTLSSPSPALEFQQAFPLLSGPRGSIRHRGDTGT